MDDEQLGTGWNFPPKFNKADSNVETVSGKDDIRQSLEILFSTRPGERIISPTYGCDLRQYAFEPIDEDLINSIKQTVTTAVNNFEQRLSLLNVDIIPKNDNSGQMLKINLTYTIIKTNEIETTELSVPIE